MALRWGGALHALLGYAIPFAYGAIAYGLIWMLAFGTFAEPESIARIAQRMGWDISSPAVVVPLYVVLMGTTQIVLNLARALGEEIGWRGWMFPKLQSRMSTFKASIILAVVITLWHVHPYSLSEIATSKESAYLTGYFPEVVERLIITVPIVLVITFIYNNTNGSLPGPGGSGVGILSAAWKKMPRDCSTS